MSDGFGYEEAVQLGNTGQEQQADGCIALFHKKAIKHPSRSEAEGRPVFITKNYIKIIVPGDRLSQVDRPVQDVDKTRFSGAWGKFLRGHEQVVDGTPLTEWPYLDVAMVATLRALEFRTVESVAAAADSAIGQVMGGNSLRDRARAFLKGGGETEKALRTQIKNLETQVTMLQAQFDTARRHISAEITASEGVDATATATAAATAAAPAPEPTAPVKRKRGRPRKHPA